MNEQTTPTVRVIKRYSNRKLYDTTDSKYVTLGNIGSLVAAGEEVQVVDNKTKTDITVQTLALVIAADQATGNPAFPIGVNDLDDLIKFGGNRAGMVASLDQETVEKAAEVVKAQGGAPRALDFGK